MTLTAKAVIDMTPEERRAALQEIAFPKLTKPREARLSNLDDEQVLEALTMAVWLGTTRAGREPTIPATQGDTHGEGEGKHDR